MENGKRKTEYGIRNTEEIQNTKYEIQNGKGFAG